MALSFCETAARLPNAVNDVDGAITRYKAAQAALTGSGAVLDNLATTYADVIAGIAAGVAANPADAAWLNLQATKNLVVSDKAGIADRVAAVLLAFAKVETFGAAAVTAALNAIG